MSQEWQGPLRPGEKPNMPAAEIPPVIDNNMEREHFRPGIEFNINADSDVDVLMMLKDNLKQYRVYASKELDYILDIQNKEDTEAEIIKFIHSFYKENKSEIERKVTEAKNEWVKVDDSFFEKVDRLFGNFPWPLTPDGGRKYTATASILNIFPRDIREKSFTFPANPKFNYNAKQTIAHEMLHFITYPYLETKFGLKPSKAGNQDNTFWQFTENLNALIEGEEMWAEFMAGRKPRIKPDCAVLYEKMEPIWDKDKNIDNLIKQIFDLK